MIAGKANTKVRFVRRNVLSNDPTVEGKTYKQFVRAVMEYVCASWKLLTQTQDHDLEAVRHRTTDLPGI